MRCLSRISTPICRASCASGRTKPEPRLPLVTSPGQGTTFRIYLPRVASEVQVAGPTLPAPVGGHETILLVEDDEMVRDLTREVLHEGGYAVLASAPGGALSLAERHAGSIHLLLTDVVMPDIGGRELARHMARISPAARSLTTRAGLPTATAYSGTSRDTTEPVPTTAWLPMRTPGRMMILCGSQA